MPVHVIGNAAIDTTFMVDRLPEAGETLNAADSHEGFGGKGLNQAVAARRAGAEVTLWAAIGRDPEGERIAGLLVAEGLDPNRLTRLDRRTDRSALVVDAKGENLIISAVGCARHFDHVAMTTVGARFTPGDIAVFQNNLVPAATEAAFRAARARGAQVVFNASPLGVDGTPPLGLVDLLVVNHGEAAALAGQGTPEDMARTLRRQGARTVIVTLGADGAVVAEGEGTRRLPAEPVAAVDTSGAGDVFCGVLAACLSLSRPGGRPSLAAIAAANRAAALAVTRRGTMAACPTRAQLAEILVPLQESLS